MNVLVTGGFGFIGSHLVESLVELGHEVFILDDFSTGDIDNLISVSGKFAWRLCDISTQAARSTFVDFSPEVVFHLAAQSAISISNKDPIKDLRTNAIGALVIANLCKEHNARLVFSSTSAVYDANCLSEIDEQVRLSPNTPYGISKLAAELYIRYALPKNSIILRYANVYGPRQVRIGENQIIAQLFEHFEKKRPFKLLTNGVQKRDFIFVEDVVNANIAAMESDATGIFNIASGESKSINYLLECFEEIYNVRGYEWERPDKEDERGDVHMRISKAEDVLGWHPEVELSEGLRKTMDWWQTCKK